MGIKNWFPIVQVLVIVGLAQNNNLINKIFRPAVDVLKLNHSFVALFIYLQCLSAGAGLKRKSNGWI